MTVKISVLEFEPYCQTGISEDELQGIRGLHVQHLVGEYHAAAVNDNSQPAFLAAC